LSRAGGGEFIAAAPGAPRAPITPTPCGQVGAEILDLPCAVWCDKIWLFINTPWSLMAWKSPRPSQSGITRPDITSAWLIAPAGHGARCCCVNRTAPSGGKQAPGRAGRGWRGSPWRPLKKNEPAPLKQLPLQGMDGVPSRPSWRRSSNHPVPVTHVGSNLTIF
jgi:hypothetical protein